MIRSLFNVLPVIAVLAGSVLAGAAEVRPTKQVVVIPIQEEIAQPTLYILRRGLKEAITEHADVVVLDLKTPGGAIDVTFEMMEALEKFPGTTIAYVNNEAMSAGAFVSAVTSEIWFAPDGVIGAAAPVTSTGQDVDSTMKMKLVSYLKARMRAVSEGKGYRGLVVSAMIDPDVEVKIDGQVLKEKGAGLLSLTATEAMKTYGDPAMPLLGAGIAPDLDSLLAKRFGKGGYTVHRLDITWSERLAVWLNEAAPVLTGLGLLGLFVGFKMGNFGTFGIAGASLLALVFFGSFVAGFSGHEPIVAFILGAILLLLEMIFFHSAGFLGILGVILMMGSLMWSMVDLWPNEPIQVAWSADAFMLPVINCGLGLVIAGVLGALAIRFLPHGWLWDRMVIHSTVRGSAQTASAEPGAGVEMDRLIGRVGVAATSLRPFGQILLEGRRYEATVGVGTIDPGSPVVVVARRDFGFVVEKAT